MAPGVAFPSGAGGREVTTGLYRFAVVAIVSLIVLVGCAQPPAERGSARPRTDSTGGSGGIKTLSIGQLNATTSYGPWDFSNTSGGGTALQEVHSVSLVTSSKTGGYETRLAARIPSFDDGTIVILPDGRMRTTWTLRPNVKWQDGAPFTSDDVIFSWRLVTHPDLLSSREDHIRKAELVEAPDPLTVVITWPNTYFKALDLVISEFWPFPRHILGTSFANIESRDSFLGLPYFTTEYVQLGPFRLVDWGLGENQVFEAFDGYFLGRPKVDRVILRTIGDVNTMLVNLQARALDMTSEKTLPLDMFIRLRDEWKQTGEGTVVSRQENWRYIWFQFRPEHARPVELAQDPRLRRGLLYGLDRDGLRELLMPGVENTSADTFMPSNDPRASIVGQPFARYRYDTSRALQEFADGGWRRGSDGRMLNRAGEQVQLEVRGNEPDEKELAFVSAGWRQLGFEITEYIPPSRLARDNEFKSKYPTMETRARSTGDAIFISFDGRLVSSAENRWQGANTSGYTNPALDRLSDRLQFTIDEREQGQMLRDMGEILATDLPAMPTYYRTIFAAVGKGVRALLDDYAMGATGSLARNAHVWEKD